MNHHPCGVAVIQTEEYDSPTAISIGWAARLVPVASDVIDFVGGEIL
jgi:hypothetical protein